LEEVVNIFNIIDFIFEYYFFIFDFYFEVSNSYKCICRQTLWVLLYKFFGESKRL